MNEKPANDHELESVLLRVLDETADASERSWLNESLRHDPDLRKRACRFLVDDSLLRDEEDAARQTKALLQTLGERNPAHGPVATPRHWQGLLGFVNQHGLAVLSIAAVMVIALGVQNLVTVKEIGRLHALGIADPGQEEGSADLAYADKAPNARIGWAGMAPATVVGRVTGLDHVVWEEGDAALAFGDSLLKGRTVRLASGVLELLLATGAKVTIEGPAHFEASSLSESSLTRGKIAAAVPRAARGYTVLTPTSEVVDIGTQFGVVVEESGDTELHVFDGDVVARSRLVGASPELLHAMQDEAMRFGGVSDKPKRFAARTNDFVRRLGPNLLAGQLPPLPVTDGLGLWYAADFIPEAEIGGPVATWRDLLVGDNDFADDAWQFDARRCPQKINDHAGRPAIRFDGWSTFLATSPMETSDRQTLIVAYAPAPTSFANDYHGGILLKYPTGAPSLELAVFDDHSTRGWVWPGPGSKENVGIIRSAPVEGLGVSLVVYTYDSIAGRAELWANGKSQGVTDAPLKIRQPGRRFIGNHPNSAIEAGFLGNLYEVLVYDNALDTTALTQLNAYFQERYELDLNR
ncbi:FecR protein [Botrimarina colliarenosi]|uniref:FecR protein n=1 Tax=Botrimarina colliarenosi TaxID=2528001 RepID=A0A5C6A0F9_9BACT|nr:FecR domain-containing protein [Botrimarina colliarenosi]TWT92023.1 FecR protein [Botrimarina colliarenosi]